MNSATGFVLFGKSHIAVLSAITFICITVWPLSRWILRRGWVKPVAWTLALVIVLELCVKTVGYSVYGVPWPRLLPLQICDINALLCALMLVMRRYGVYQVAYFWAMAGSVSAMLTPDLHFNFPHPIFAFFFLGHGFSVVAVLYATFAFGFQPRLRSVGIALLATVMYGSVMLAMNYILGTNFLYLRAKPTAPSVLDYMGPWPWYVVGLVILCVVACLIVYAPFPLARKLRSTKTTTTVMRCL